MISDSTPSLALGTAQFGLPYGITNTQGQVTENTAAGILATAKERWPDIVLDTAPGYGSSEEVLGRLVTHNNFRIVTKTNVKNPDIRQSFLESLRKLNQTSLYGLLDHNATFLLGPQGSHALKIMQEIKSEGLVSKIGASIYSTDELDKISTLGDIDLIQIPMNVLDQRVLKSGRLQQMKDRGIEIHVRSAFLQGLLLTDPDNLPPHMLAYKPHFMKLSQFSHQHGMTLAQSTLAFLKQQAEIDHIVIGTTSVEQWNDIVAAYDYNGPTLDWGSLACDDPVLLNPALWPKAA